MHSSNPIFNRSEGFNGRGSARGATSGVSYPAYDSPASQAPAWGAGGPTAPQQTPYVDQGRMTIDSVVQKTAITMGVVRFPATPPMQCLSATTLSPQRSWRPVSAIHRCS